MPALTEETSRNPRDYDIPLHECIVYDIIDNLDIVTKSSARVYEHAFFADKLKEDEIAYKSSIETAHSDIILAIKRSCEARKTEFKPENIKKQLEFVIEDAEDCCRKLDSIRRGNYNSGIVNPLNRVYYNTDRYIRTIDTCISRCLTVVKSVDSNEDILNKANYSTALQWAADDYINLSEEQEKLYKSGKDIFSRESLMLNIKKLRTFRSRIVRIFNKSFGKDSIFAPFNLQIEVK